MRISGPIAAPSIFENLIPMERASPTSAALAIYERAPSNPSLGRFVASQTQAQRDAEAQGDEDLQFSGKVPLFEQDIVNITNPNACGTTSLAMVVASFGLIPATYEAAAQVDAEVRGWGGFTAPDDLQAYAQRQGLNSQGYNQASLNDLMKATSDPSNRVMVMVDGGGSPHWMVCLGVAVDPKTHQESVTCADPSSGCPTSIPASEFMQEWKDPFAGNKDGEEVAGYGNYMQVFSTHALAPGDSDISASQRALHDFTSTANAAAAMLDDFTQGDVLGGLGQLGSMVGDGVHTLMALPEFLAQAGMRGVLDAAGASPPVAAVVGAVTTLGGVGSAINGAVTQATGSSVIGEVVEVLADPVDAVVNAVSDWFSGL